MKKIIDMNINRTTGCGFGEISNCCDFSWSSQDRFPQEGEISKVLQRVSYAPIWENGIPMMVVQRQCV